MSSKIMPELFQIMTFFVKEQFLLKSDFAKEQFYAKEQFFMKIMLKA